MKIPSDVTKKFIFAGVALLLGLPGPVSAESKDSDLRVELRGNGGLPAFFSPSNPNLLHFILYSEADNLQIYSELSSWGYNNRSFNAVSSDDQRAYRISRRPRQWRSDGPTTAPIKKGDFLIFDINFCDGTWMSNPPLEVQPGENLLVSGRFRIEAGPDALRDDVWTGTSESGKSVEVAFDEACVKRLNGQPK